MPPALHLDAGDGLAHVGLVVMGRDGKLTVEIVRSDRQRIPAEAMQTALSAPALAYEDLLGRWAPEHVDRFVAGHDEPPRFSEIVRHLKTVIGEALELTRPEEATLLASWIVGTYVHPVFPAYPRLDLRGEKGSGKSKALKLIASTAFNGLLRVLPTPAVLFRSIEALKPTFCLDEVESLASGDKKEDLLSILNAGYQRGGRVDRVEGESRTLRSYSVYSPIALAGIRGLNAVTEDRAITLVMRKGLDRTKLNAILDPADPRLAAIRDLGYRLALLRYQDVQRAYRDYREPEWLVAREHELWRPLLVVASLAEQDGETGLVEALLTLAREQGQERAGLSPEAEALLTVLSRRLAGRASVAVQPGDLCEELLVELGWSPPLRAETVGRWLKRLGFSRDRRDSRGSRYVVTGEQIREVRRRYSGLVPEAGGAGRGGGD